MTTTMLINTRLGLCTLRLTVLLCAVSPALADVLPTDAPPISVGSVMTPQATAESILTTVEPPVPPTY